MQTLTRIASKEQGIWVIVGNSGQEPKLRYEALIDAHEALIDEHVALKTQLDQPSENGMAGLRNVPASGPTDGA